MKLDPDFIDFFKSFNRFKVRYLVVGGYATIFHGYSRSTNDIDIWVDRTKINYGRIEKSFLHFGMPVFDMTEEAFLNNEEFDVFTFGRPPTSIDLMNRVKGLSFETAWKNAIVTKWDAVQIRIISKEDLKTAKKQAGRFRDLDDLEHL